MFRLVLIFIAATFVVAAPVFAQPGATALETIDAFAAAGVPIGDVQALDEATDTNHLLGRPGSYVEKVFWQDTRLPEYRYEGSLEIESGGSIERFATPADLERRRSYLSAFDGTIFGAEYRFVADRQLLRLPFALTPSQAAEYNAVFGGTPG